MFDSFERYYYENCIVPYYEYMEQKSRTIYGRSRDLKLAISCATGLFHLREHLPDNASISRNKFEKLCVEYSLIADVVNASKHKNIDKNNPRISNANQISEFVVSTKYKDTKGEYTYTDKVINLKLNDGSNVFLHDLLYKVINCWDSYLWDKNLVSKRRVFAKPDDTIHRSREECGEMDIEMVSGLPFNMYFQLLQYNYETNIIEPIDLTGSELRMRIYKPFEFDLNVTNNETGITLTKTVTLSREHTSQFYDLETDEERNKFLSGIDYINEQYIALYEELKHT